jgi:hypothetical protein
MDNSALLTATPHLDYTTFAQNWSQLGAGSLSSSTEWGGFDMNATGQYQVASSSSTGGVWYSLNYGLTWAQSTGLPVQAYTSVSMSASGQFQVVGAAVAGTGVLYTSSNYGASWTQVVGGPTGKWYSFCISASGQYMSGVQNTAGSSIWYSTNYGATWVQSASIPGYYNGICCSASGQYQTAVTYLVGGSSIYISSNYGANWVLTTAPSVPWTDVCMSASGQYQTAIVFGSGASYGIYYSANYGLSWTQASGAPTTVNWYSVCCTASGQYQVAVMNNASNTGVYYSMNYGVNWLVATTAMGLPSGTPRWTFSEISDNGQYCTIVAQTGHVYQTVLRQPSLYTSGGAVIAGNVGIGTMNTSTILQVSNSAITTSYTSRVTMGVSDGDPDATTTYGMLNLTRPNNVTDHKGHIAFIRNGNTIQSLGYLQGSNTFGWVASGNMNTTSGIFMMSTGNIGIGITNPTTTLHVSGGNSLFVGNPGITNLNPSGAVGQNSVNARFGRMTSDYGGGIVMYDYTTTANNGWTGVKNIISRLVDLTYMGYISFGSVGDDRGIGFGINGATTMTNPSSSTEKMCILTNGRVGIGKTNPANTLDITGELSVNNGVAATESGQFQGLYLSYVGTGSTGYGSIVATNPGSTYNSICLNPIAPGGQGNVGIGLTNPDAKLHIYNSGLAMKITTADSSDMIQLFGNISGPLATPVYVMPIRIGSTSSLRGGILWDGTNLLYVNASDYRLKENVVPLQHGLSRIMSLNPVTYNWIEHKMAGEGFIAHEVQSIIPMAVSGKKDAIDKDGAILPQGVDYSKIVVHLVSGMQEQHTIIQQQSSTITTLESRLASLEQRLINAGIV